jgi:hypothetical protein
MLFLVEIDHVKAPLTDGYADLVEVILNRLAEQNQIARDEICDRQDNDQDVTRRRRAEEEP